MTSTVNDLATRLVSQGVGTLGTDLFGGGLPSVPVNCLALIEYAGEEPRLKAPGEVALDERPRVQVIARGKSYRLAEEKARAAYEAIQCAMTTINGTLYLRIDALQTPFYLKNDENGNTLFVFNVQVRRFNITKGD